MHPRVVILGHRGEGVTNPAADVFNKRLPARQDPYYEGCILPENSLSSIQWALTHGADGFECDVYISADGVPMVVHDSQVARNADGYHYWSEEQGQDVLGNIRDYTCQELKEKFTIGNGESMPTLDEVIQLALKFNPDYVAKHGCNLVVNIELKGDSDIADSVCRVVRKYTDDPECPLTVDDFLFNSFDQESLIRLKKLDQRLHCSFGLISKKLYGEVKMPGWIPLKSDYVPSLSSLIQEAVDLIALSAVDFVTSDVQDELVALCARNKVFLTATTHALRLLTMAENNHSPEAEWSPLRREKKEVKRIISLVRKYHLPFYYKADAPGKIKQYVENLLEIKDIVEKEEKATDEYLTRHAQNPHLLFSLQGRLLRYAKLAESREDELGCELASAYGLFPK